MAPDRLPAGPEVAVTGQSPVDAIRKRRLPVAGRTAGADVGPGADRVARVFIEVARRGTLAGPDRHRGRVSVILADRRWTAPVREPVTSK